MALHYRSRNTVHAQEEGEWQWVWPPLKKECGLLKEWAWQVQWSVSCWWEGFADDLGGSCQIGEIQERDDELETKQKF